MWHCSVISGLTIYNYIANFRSSTLHVLWCSASIFLFLTVPHVLQCQANGSHIILILLWLGQSSRGHLHTVIRCVWGEVRLIYIEHCVQSATSTNDTYVYCIYMSLPSHSGLYSNVMHMYVCMWCNNLLTLETFSFLHHCIFTWTTVGWDWCRWEVYRCHSIYTLMICLPAWDLIMSDRSDLFQWYACTNSVKFMLFLNWIELILST